MLAHVLDAKELVGFCCHILRVGCGESEEPTHLLPVKIGGTFISEKLLVGDNETALWVRLHPHIALR
jgi:hypothetical protein